MSNIEFEQAHLEAILTTNAVVKAIAADVRQAREDRMKQIDLLNQRLDGMQDLMKELDLKSRDIEIRVTAMELFGKPMADMTKRISALEWAWIKIAGFATGLSILIGMITAWIIVYLPRWMSDLKGGGL